MKRSTVNMPLLTLLVVAGVVTWGFLILVIAVSRLKGARNVAFFRSWPEIDFPPWRVAPQHLVGLASTVLWLLRWPSITELWCSMALVPLLFIPFPTILNKLLEECMAYFMGNARHGPGGGSVRESLHAVRCWFKVMLAPPPPEGRDRQGLMINQNHSLMCYAQTESTSGMHKLDQDILHGFPTPDPSSRANAVMMARCAEMSYDRGHNIDQAVRSKWSPVVGSTAGSSSGGGNSYELVTAWSFDRVSITSKLEKGERCGANESTAINTDAFLLQRRKTITKEAAAEVALVLAFRGAEALQTIDWISDLAHVQPPKDARDRRIYPYGFTHQGFRDALGLKRNLAASDGGLPGFANSYLEYHTDPVDPLGTLARAPTTTDAPFTVITNKITQVIEAELNSNPGARIKFFVTGHSLGGALAHLFAGTLLLKREECGLPAAHFEAVTTFGQPRVGGQRWVQAVDNALRSIPGTSTAAQRYIRVVNTSDIVTRIPPLLGEEYQHSSHLVFIKPHFAILGGPAATSAASNVATAYTAESNKPVDEDCHAVHDQQAKPSTKPLPDQNARSPIRHLIETPDMFLHTTAACALVKLGLSLVLLLAAWRPSRHAAAAVALLAVAAAAAAAAVAPLLLPVAALAVGAVLLVSVTCFVLFKLWPELWNEILGPVAAELQVSLSQLLLAVRQARQRPVLFGNPVYACTRLLALLGPVPILFACDVVLFVCVPVLTWPALFVEPLLLMLLLAFMPPVVFCGLIDHSMAEYYTAAVLSSDADWQVVGGQPEHVADPDDREGGASHVASGAASAAAAIGEDRAALKDKDNHLLGKLKTEGNELLLLQLAEPLPADEEQELYDLLRQYGYFFLREGAQGDKVFATRHVMGVWQPGDTDSGSGSSSSGPGSSSSGSGSSSSGSGSSSSGSGSSSSESGSSSNGSQDTSGQLTSPSCSVHKLCNVQWGIPDINATNQSALRPSQSQLNPQRRTDNNTELWFEGTDNCVKATMMLTVHVCWRPACDGGSTGKLCIKLSDLKGVLESSDSAVPQAGTRIGVQALFISVAATAGDAVVALKLDMRKGPLQTILDGSLTRAPKGGWTLTEVTGEFGGSAAGPSGKVTLKAVKKGQREPGRMLTTAYAYEPTCHLLHDLPPSGYRPVSMVLLRDVEATKLCDPSGRELDRIVSASSDVYEIVGRISHTAPTSTNLAIILAVELVWLVMEPEEKSHSLKRWPVAKLKGAALQARTLLQSVTAAAEQTTERGKC